MIAIGFACQPRSTIIPPHLLPSKQHDYFPQLDGLRALAVLAVLYTHFLPENFWLVGVYWGGLGVRLFFVLSGFLITGILLRESARWSGRAGERGLLLRRFYIRRALRLTPIFYLTLILMFALDAPKTRETVWWHVFYLSNINFALTNSWQGNVAHFWTLAVEEQFYLVWPLALLFITRRKLVVAIACLIPGAILWRWLAHQNGLADIPTWVLPPDSMDALLLGALISIASYHGRLSSRSVPYATTAVVGLLVWCVGEFYSQAGDLLYCSAGTGIALFFGWVVLRAAESGTRWPWRTLQFPMLIYVGKISYGVYVIHNLVNFAFGKKLRAIFAGLEEPFASVAVALALAGLTITFAACSWHLLEAPINRYRRSFTYGP